MDNHFRQRIINLYDWREVTLFVIAGVAGLVLFIIFAGIIYGLASSDSEQVVSGPVSLSTEWTEFVPPKPLRPTKQSQEIVLDVDPSEGLVEDNLHLDRMELSNGVLLRPQIQLVDSRGNIFDAEVSRYPVPCSIGMAFQVTFPICRRTGSLRRFGYAVTLPFVCRESYGIVIRGNERWYITSATWSTMGVKNRNSPADH